VRRTALAAPVLERDAADYKVGTLAKAMKVAKRRLNEVDNDPDPYGYLQEMENELGIDVLGTVWKAAPDDPLWVKRVKSRARKAAVSKLFLQGFRPPEIAQTLELNEVQVLGDISQIEDEWRQSYMDDAEIWAARDLARLDFYLTKLAAGIDRGDTRSINSAVEIIKERANITGYRHGVQVDIESYVREVALSHGYDPEKALQVATKLHITMKQ